jgi:hypothetical protein
MQMEVEASVLVRIDDAQAVCSLPGIVLSLSHTQIIDKTLNLCISDIRS